MAQKLWQLAVTLPLSAVDEIMLALPEKALSQTAFCADANDRTADPLWNVQGFYKTRPELADFELSSQVLAASRKLKAFPVTIEEIPAQGWLEKNQASFPPIHIGRFIIHGPNERDHAPHLKKIEMEVSCAFGTGEHPTTHGCLMALQHLKLRRHMRVLDIGTGTGVLAIGAARMAACKVVASDMDHASVTIAQENIRRNGVRARVSSLPANGFRARQIARNKPYDVILSNIFARPLARLAPAMAAHLKPGGHIILAGFLHAQVPLVRNAYARNGLYLKRTLRFGAWSVLILAKRAL